MEAVKIVGKKRPASERDDLEQPGIGSPAGMWIRQLIDDGLVRSIDDALRYSNSSGDFIEICAELDHRDANEYRRLRKAYSQGGGGRSKPARDLCLALEFRDRKTSGDRSATEWKAAIGRRAGLKSRSAAVDAVNRGQYLINQGEVGIGLVPAQTGSIFEKILQCLFA